jgi:L-seryl-tRNA(Ser) seleniumtransferase
MHGSTSPQAVDPYARLGVRPIINCGCVRTVYGNSLMLPEVQAAMASAARQFVVMDELMEAVGRRLADLTGAEWGIVTAGSAAALCLATAACVAGNDPDKMLRLPVTGGMRNVVLVPKGQRFAYDHSIRMVGCRIMEVTDLDEFVVLLDRQPVAMICIYGDKEPKSKLRLEDVVGPARQHGIPVLVDAASDDLSRPDRWLARGANMVVYSSGKFLRGPQATGLLIGDRPLVEAAWWNSAPHQAFGRPLKIGKEDIVGAWIAVEHWFHDRDASAEQARWRSDIEIISSRATSHPNVSAKIIEPSGHTPPVPRLSLRWEKSAIALTGIELREKLLADNPRVMIDDIGATDCSVIIDPFSLQPGEAMIVGDRLLDVLSQSRPSAAEATSAIAVEFSGRWDVQVSFLHGKADHTLVLTQDNGTIAGMHISGFFSVELSGEARGMEISFSSSHVHESGSISYQFSGSGDNDRISGTVILGSATSVNRGPVALSQFGTARWSAQRGA